MADVLQLDLTDALAISDAYATAQLLLKLKEKMASMPKELLEQLLPLADNLVFETGMLVEEGFKKAKVMSKRITKKLVVSFYDNQKLGNERKMSDDFELNMAL